MARTSSVCLLLLVALSAVYEVQGTFLLRHYLRKIPRRSGDIQPFACQGMLKFVDVLELKCPLKPEYKSFFGKLRSYMSFISSASGSKNFDANLKGQAQGLQSAMSALGGKGASSADTSKVLDVLMTMGRTLSQQKSSGSTEMSFAQRKELIIDMVQWARTIGQFVVGAASKSGSSIDMSSLGIDGVDANADAAAGGSPSSGVSPSTGGAGGSTDTSSGIGATGSTSTSSGTGATGSASAGGNYTAGGSASSNTQSPSGASAPTGSSTQGGSSFGRSFSGKTGSASYEGSVNYQSGQKASQQSTSGR
ncbi:hypothetical protein EUTSA_v10004661mg [Eutrema salsugineum]|uniref:DUF1216 domain-containing protein n=1 Tax=Eutrema salsugineum TaxID=72664 RepID=V4KYU8_EUTSA|nr:probable GH family 25 lysozyme 3 [Eutrema salsugineum]ESQ32623.1 hypothetical protein EUTSA_v10004661mg [Eutrema salsugineum]